MSNFAILGLGEAAFVGAVTSTVVGLCSGIGFLKGSEKMHSVSKYCAKKEEECSAEPKKSLAYKIGKWSALAFGTLIGLTGAAAFGFGVASGASIGIVAAATLIKYSPLALLFTMNIEFSGVATLAIACGSVAAAIKGWNVIKRDIDQATDFRQPKLFFA